MSGPVYDLISDLEKTGANIVIFSTIDPVNHFQISELSDKNETEGIKQEQKYKMLHWSGILTMFNKIYITDDTNKISKNDLIDAFEVSEKQHSKSRQKEVFINECLPTYRLRKIGLYLAGIKNLSILTSESIIQEVQNHAHSYYNVIWGCLAKDEKSLMIQLCHTGLAHRYNMGVLLRLYRLNLVKADPYPEPINKSFRNFVLANFKANDLKAEISDTKWNRLKIPFMIILILTALFFGFTQQDSTSQIIASISAVASLIPALLKTLRIFQFSKPELSSAVSEVVN